MNINQFFDFDFFIGLQYEDIEAVQVNTAQVTKGPLWVRSQVSYQ